MDTTTHLLLWKQKVLVANMAPHKLHVWVKLFTPNQEISLHQNYGHSKQVTFHATSAIGPAGHGTCIPKLIPSMKEMMEYHIRQLGGDLTYPWNHPCTVLIRMAKDIT